MSTAIKLPDELIKDAKANALVNSRSTPKQIQYWCKIGKISEENPDLNYNFIRDIMLAQAETESTAYTFG